MSSKSYRRCLPLCALLLMEDHLHADCVVCLREKHVRLALKGDRCMHCQSFSLKKLTYIRCLGLMLNSKKNMLSPTQRTTFIGVI